VSILLAVSPHLDDAVFSVGAFLARHADRGWRVVVATCFTASVPSPSGFALACQLDKGIGPEIDYMALRRVEDRKACATLGAEVVHLPFAEAPHRGYGSAAELFGKVHEDDAIASDLTPALRTLVEDVRPDIVLAPMAIGRHVDHVIVRRCTERLEYPQTRYWADLPYAAREGMGSARGDAHVIGGEMERKLTACSAYRSQLGFQFGGKDGIRASIQIEGSEFLTDRAAVAD
jgi:LmbE family N-acetylglucosaminyl deacetylase